MKFSKTFKLDNDVQVVILMGVDGKTNENCLEERTCYKGNFYTSVTTCASKAHLLQKYVRYSRTDAEKFILKVKEYE
jgi:hypothetical protein